MTFRVEPTSQAKQDLFEILEWLLKEGAGDTGLHWFFNLEEAMASLSEMPQRCPLAPENTSFPFEVRHLLYGRKPHVYRVLFMLEADRVVILHVWHSRRKPAHSH